MVRVTRAYVRAGLLGFLAAATLGCNGPDVRGPFEGQIVDADARAPIEGAHVVVVWTRFINYEAGRDEIDARETVTDAQGRWRIPERPTPVWEGSPFGLRRRFYVFAPEYDVADPTGTPRDEYAAPQGTITTMRRLTSREERCKALPYVASSMSITAATRSPVFRKAIAQERESLRCYER